MNKLRARFEEARYKEYVDACKECGIECPSKEFLFKKDEDGTYMHLSFQLELKAWWDCYNALLEQDMLSRLRNCSADMALAILRKEGDGSFSQSDVEEMQDLLKAIADELEKQK